MGEGDSDLGLEEETSTKYSEAVQKLIRSGERLSEILCKCE
jgi:hypothetical protein